MTERRQPTARQCEIRDATELGLLVTAPAGCGKTEALALRIKGLIDRGEVAYPRRILVLTFTNRARENIEERLLEHVTLQEIRRFVTVHNFHGLSARIIRSHGNTLGLDDAWTMPDSDWVSQECRSRGLKWQQAASVKSHLQQSKLRTLTDEEVAAELLQIADPIAIQIEQKRREERRLTYDDLPRLADLILRIDDVASLYQEHFACAIVDEFQDLTSQQLSIVQRICVGRTTYAGDLAQGIYSFTGANPEGVLTSIKNEVQREIRFAESHRSSPAVLSLVNAMGVWTKGVRLTPATGQPWPGEGLAAHREFDDQDAEAVWVLSFARALLGQAANQRIGLITRVKTRRESLDLRLSESVGIPWYRWDDPVFDSATAPILRGVLRRVQMPSFREASDPVEYLSSLVQVDEPFDPLMIELVNAGVGWIADLLSTDVDLEEIRKRIRIGEGETLITAPGLHLLTGHAGKGQQFDWVVILGLEEDSIPAFQAKSDAAVGEEARVLSVMISRARHGVITTRTSIVSKPWGEKVAFPSRFIAALDRSDRYLAWDEARSWLNQADWQAIASR